MTVVQVRKSNKSGVEIPDGTGARLRLMYADDRDDLRADLTEEEAEEIAKFMEPVKPRPERRTGQRQGKRVQL